MPSYPTYPLLTLAIVAATLLIQPVPNHAQSVGAIPTESPTIIGPTAVNIERVEPAARIAGLGWGMFLCLAVGVAFLVICILLSQHPLASLLFVGAAILEGILIATLKGLPKVSVGSILKIPDSLDYTYQPRFAFALLTLLIAFGATGVAGYHYLVPPVYAIHPGDEED